MEDAFALLHAYLQPQLGEENIQVNDTQTAIRVYKPAGGKSVTGSFKFAASDTHAAEGQTLVSMRREKGSILQWRLFWWSVVRNPQIDRFVVRGDI